VTAGSTVTTYAAGAPVPFTADATYAFGGIAFGISGTPADGDSFTVRPNTGGIGDNRNALLLAGLQTQRVLAGGSMSYTDAYSHLVSEVGMRTREMEITGSAQTRLLDEANNRQQGFSGVNLDEEAARLMQYQQAYQAAAKVMQMASDMFETLLSIR
jgi:flagellar hook-associated protein 1 FlgK